MRNPSHPLKVAQVRDRLAAANGGYEVVHESPGLELGVYVLVAPEPDRQQPHEDDELYFVLEGRGVLEVEGKACPLEEGDAIFVPAGAEHEFTGYEGLSVLVVFAKGDRARPDPARLLAGAGREGEEDDERREQADEQEVEEQR